MRDEKRPDLRFVEWLMVDATARWWLFLCLVMQPHAPWSETYDHWSLRGVLAWHMNHV